MSLVKPEFSELCQTSEVAYLAYVDLTLAYYGALVASVVAGGCEWAARDVGRDPRGFVEWCRGRAGVVGFETGPAVDRTDCGERAPGFVGRGKVGTGERIVLEGGSCDRDGGLRGDGRCREVRVDAGVDDSGVNGESLRGGIASDPVGVVPSRDYDVGRGGQRGPNFLRNQRNRFQQRARKLAKRDSERVGFFSGCTSEVQVSLRESRAKLLVLENERKALEETKKLERLRSPVAVIEEAMRMVRMAGSCAKAANDHKVAGWAATLAESHAESIARSASESLQSLDSVTSAREAQKRKEQCLLSEERERKEGGGRSGFGESGKSVCPSSVVSVAGVRGSVKPALHGFTLEQLTSGISDRGSVSSSGVLYNKHTAASWIKGYGYIEKYSGHSEQQMAKLAGVSIGEVKKYYRLKAEFGL